MEIAMTAEQRHLECFRREYRTFKEEMVFIMLDISTGRPTWLLFCSRISLHGSFTELE